jgi:hypothetical protein
MNHCPQHLVSCAFVLDQLHNYHISLMFRMLHADLDSPGGCPIALETKTVHSPTECTICGANGVAPSSIVKHLDIFPSYHLFHATIHSIPYFDKVIVKKDQVLAIQAC